MLTGKFEKQIKLARENDYPDLIIGSYKKVNEKGELNLNKIYNEKTDSIWINLIETNLGITSSNLFNSKKFEKKINWNENLQSSQEYTLMFELLKANSSYIFCSDVHTLIVCRSTGSISTLNKKENWIRYINLRKKIIDYLIIKQIDVNLNKCYQSLFSAIRSLYPYDSEQAIHYFKEIIPKIFKPEVSLATTKSYITIYNIFGFRITEKIKKMMK